MYQKLTLAMGTAEFSKYLLFSDKEDAIHASLLTEYVYY